MCPEWYRYTQRPHVGNPKLCSRETHSLNEANLFPEHLRRNKPDVLEEITLFNSSEGPEHPEPFDERSARMSSSAEAPGHPEPFDERSARMKCDWEASFELTAVPAANFFSAPKCRKSPINDAPAEK